MLKTIAFTDITLREEAHRIDNALSFKEKIEIAKQLDKLQVDAIEFAPLQDEKADTLLIKTVAALVRQSAVALPIALTQESIAASWEAIRHAAHPRLVVSVPTSPIQMAYTCQKKAPAVLDMLSQLVAQAKAVCPEVEFAAEDASRSELPFLAAAISAAIEAGASVITVCDTAGVFLPEECRAFVQTLYAQVPALLEVTLYVQCANTLGMAAACAIEAVQAGAAGVKASASQGCFAILSDMANVIRYRGDSLGLCCRLKFTEMQRIAGQIAWITQTRRAESTPFENGANNAVPQISFDKHDTLEAVIKGIRQLGYDLSEEDNIKVYEAFCLVAQKKSIGAKELDAIIASTALQVPPTYKLNSYVINSGNVISASANIQMEKNGQPVSGICVGDGPIDAAFLAIEQIAGRHYEVDDFQIQAVTEGREAMGSALVRLRSGGKLYSGNGISTDIIGASIKAYLNALNKIVYEEEGNE